MNDFVANNEVDNQSYEITVSELSVEANEN